MKEFNEKEVRVLPGRVLIKPLMVEAQTASGIFLPGSSVKQKQEGIVISVGAKVSASIVVGSKVNWNTYVGQEIEMEGQKYLVMEEADILSVIPQ
jgi:chaperonin GroES